MTFDLSPFSLSLGSQQNVIDGGPTLIAAPTISGTPVVGETLTATQAQWDATGSITRTYEWLRNSAAIPGATSLTYTLTNLDGGVSISFQERAQDEVGFRTASSGSVLISAAPDFFLSITRDGRTVTIEALSVEGLPTPTLTLTALTLAGADALGNQTGTGPWIYVTPSSASAQVVAATVEASNAGGTISKSGSISVPADLAAPVWTTQPAFDAASYVVGDTLSWTPGIASGEPTLTLTTLDNGAADKLSEVVGATWDSTGETAGTISLQYSADNGFGAPVLSDIITVTLAASGAPDTTPPEWNSLSFLTLGEAGYLARLDGVTEGGEFVWALTSSDPTGATNTAVETAGDGGTALTDQVAFGAEAVGADGDYSLDIPYGLTGNHWLIGILRDAAGNISTVAVDGPVAVNTAYIVWSVTTGPGEGQAVATVEGDPAPTWSVTDGSEPVVTVS